MSTWRNVGITYLKYADICATHVRNALKEPAKTKAKSSSNMHARIIQWEAGKRGDPRKLRLSPPPRCPPPLYPSTGCCPTCALVQIPAERGRRQRDRGRTEVAYTPRLDCPRIPPSFSFTGPSPPIIYPHPHSHRACASRRLCFGSAPATPPLPRRRTQPALLLTHCVPQSQKSWRRRPRWRRVVNVLQTKLFARAGLVRAVPTAVSVG